MEDRNRYRFEFQGRAPEALPMARLAAYLADLSALLGNPGQVYFERLDPEMASIVGWAEAEAVPAIQERLRRFRVGEAARDAALAYANLSEKLAQDGAGATLFTPEPGETLEFPQPGDGSEAATFPSVTQTGTVEGTLIGIGGMGDPVPVRLADGERVYRCEAFRELAQKLACHLFGRVLRARGTGTWTREASGQWTLRRFRIEGFGLLDEAPLTQVVQDLREIPDSGWRSIDDPLEELRRLRQGTKSMEKAG